MDNILDTLASAFGPSEAEAAGISPQEYDRRQRLQQFAKNQEAGIRMMLAQQAAQAKIQQAQAAKATDPMRQLQIQRVQQQLAAGAAKAQPGPQLSDILGGTPSATPSGARAPDVIFRGTTPGTGTPFFTNRPEAVGSMFGPEAQKAYEAQVAKAQPPAQAPGAVSPTLGGAPDMQSIERLGQFNTWADKNKIPSQIRKQMSDTLFPWAKEDKELTPDQYSKLYRYNESTGQLEAPSEPAGAQSLLKQGYRSLTPKQLETFYAADTLDAPLKDFKSMLDRVRDVSPWALKADQIVSSRGAQMFSPLKEPGLGVEFNKSLFNVTQLFDQMVAGARGAASPQLAALRQAALPGILNSPELRDRLMGSFESIVDNLKRINKAKALGVSPKPQDLKALDSFESSIGAINKQAMSQLQTPGMPSGGLPGQAQQATGLPQGVKVTRVK